MSATACVTLRRLAPLPLRHFEKCSIVRNSPLSFSLETRAATRLPVTRTGVQSSCRSFSDAAPKSSIFSSPIDWWRKRQEGQEMEKYKTRMTAMAEKETWAIGDLLAELDEVVNSWRTKMPGVSGMKETEMAKKLHQTLLGLVKVAGKDASDDILDKMTRKDKLLAAIEGQTTVEEINTAIDQFRIMSLMQKVVRQRKLDGKTIPSTPEGVQALVQAQGSKMLSKAQKSKMGKDQARKIMRRR